MPWQVNQVLVKQESMHKEVRALEKWFKKVQRPLPWRMTSDPYKIWVSEVMLQQTQVVTVIPYYEKFLEAFPTLHALADAKEETVLRHWSGLGYYSRARNLQKGAQYLVENFAGQFPKTRAEILKVPGIGPYTAGAILSIAFDLKEPLVDGNVVRVFCRFFGIQKPVTEKSVVESLWKYALDWVQASESPRVFNQALMELGATVCTKASPQCTICPIQENCIARQKDLTAVIPMPKVRKQTEDLYWIPMIHQKGNEFFLVQNPKGEWWESMWDFPKQEFESLAAVKKTLSAFKAKSKDLTFLNAQKHTVTHHRIHVYPVLTKSPLKSEIRSGEFFHKSKIKTLPMSSLAKKILNEFTD